MNIERKNSADETAVFLDKTETVNSTQTQEQSRDDAVIDLGKLPVGALFRKYFIPTLLGMLSLSAVTALDGVFVGHGIGSDGIAAVNLCIPVLMLFTGIGLMAGAGASVSAAILMSRGKIKAARINATQSLLLVSAIAIVPTFLMMIFPTETARLLGSSEHLTPMVREYLLWFAPQLIFQMWCSVCLFLIRLDGRPRFASFCTILAALISVVLDWLFIFEFKWGLMGAAFAPTLSLFFGGVIGVAYLGFFAKTLRFYRVKWGWKHIRRALSNVSVQCKIGSSALLTEATLAMLMLVGNWVFMHYLGDDGVGAFGIACYYIPFVFMVGNAVAQSAQPIISYNFGLGNRLRVRTTEQIALFTSVFCGLVVSALFTFFPRELIGLFIDTNNAAARLAIDGFPWFAAGFAFFVVNLCAIGFFQSIERLRPATFFALLRGFIFLVPSFIFLPKIAGTHGIWLALSCSEFCTTVAILFYFLRTQKKNRLAYETTVSCSIDAQKTNNLSRKENFRTTNS